MGSIVCLGRVHAQSVLGIQVKISDAVNQTFAGLKNSKVLVTYHPASILRTESTSEKALQKNQLTETLARAKIMVSE